MSRTGLLGGIVGFPSRRVPGTVRGVAKQPRSVPAATAGRPVAFLLAATFALLSGSLFLTQTEAHAFDPRGVATLLPAGITGAGILSGAGAGGAGIGAVSSFGGGGAAAAAGAVAVAPVAIAAAAALVTGGALYLGWKWAGNASSAGSSYDPPVAATTPLGGDWTSSGCPGVSDACAWSAGSPTNAGFNLLVEGYGVQADRAPTGGEVLTFSWSRYGTSSLSMRDATVRCRIEVGSAFLSAPVKTLGTPSGSTTISLGGCPNGSKPYALYVAHSANTATTYNLPTVSTAAPTTSNPGGTQVTTVPTSQCSNGASVAGQAIVFTGATSPDLLPPILAPACPAGTTRTGLTTPSTFPDGSTAPAPLAPWTAPTVPAGYPDCAGTSASTCVLTLTQTAADAAAELCNGTGICTGWHSDSTTEVVVTTQTQMQGETRDAFRKRTGLLVQDLPDGTTQNVRPRTRPDGKTMRCQWGPYTLPTNECTTIPTEAPPAAETVAEPGTCALSGFSLNPVSWVVVPLKCLFIPRQSVVNALGASLSDAWSGSAPDTAVTMLGGLFTPFANLPTSKGSCEGPEATFTLPIVGDTTMRPFNACPELIALALQYLIPIESAGLYIAAVWRGSKLLASSTGTQVL